MIENGGPHLLEITGDQAPGVKWARRANIVKVVDRDGSPRAAELLGRLQDENPDLLTLFRPYYSEQDLSVNGEVYGYEAKRRLYGRVPTFVEGPNETGLSDPVRLLHLNAEMRRVVVDLGSELAGISGGTGWWTEDVWRRWRDLDYLGLKVIALHAYWNCPSGPLLDDWSALRHRRVHVWTGGYHPKFIITEAGRDRLVDGDKAGWLAQGVSRDDYLAEIVTFSRSVDADRAYVIGFTMFTNGATGPVPERGEPGYLDFELDSLVDPILALGTERRRLWVPGGGDSNVKIAIAVVPSNQGYNTAPAPAGHPQPYNEMGGMRWLGGEIVSRFAARGVTVKNYEAPPDSSTSVVNIDLAYRQAKTWLDGVTADVKLCLSLHTDSAGPIGSHTAYCAGHEVGQPTSTAPGFLWGERLARRVKARLLTKAILALDYSDYLFYLRLKPYTSVLLEVCAHSVLDPDLNNLYAHGTEVAEDIVDETVAWASGSSTDELARLRAENLKLRTAITQAQTALAVA